MEIKKYEKTSEIKTKISKKAIGRLISLPGG